MKVEHEREGRRFVVRTDAGEGELTYVPTEEGVLNLVHTGVDPELRGQGIADDLAEAAFAYARDNGFRVVPSCGFIKKWLERHPDQRDVVAG